MNGITYMLLFLLLPFSAVSQTPAEEIHELLSAYAKEYAFNGSVLVADGNRVILEKGYGYRDAAHALRNDSATIFQAGSLTKSFTAATVLKLQEEHLLSVQDHLSKYLPEYPGGENITLDQLLTHTAGIYNYTSEPGFMENRASRFASVDSLISFFRNHPPDFEPGTNFRYSNSGYVLLGAVIEKITRKSWYRVVREKILIPLQLNNSGFDFAHAPGRDKAIGYRQLDPFYREPATPVDSGISYAAGSLYTTTPDLFRWSQAWTAGKLLNDSSLHQAFTPGKGNYGYGWAVDTVYGDQSQSHAGGINGFSAFIGRVPAKGITIILLDNRGSAGLEKIAQDIFAILNHQPYDFPRFRQQIQVDTTILSQYSGIYQLQPHLMLTVELMKGRLMAKPTDHDWIELFPEKENFFFLKLVDVQIEFIRSPEGKVERLVLYEHGNKSPAVKIK